MSPDGQTPKVFFNDLGSSIFTRELSPSESVKVRRMSIRLLRFEFFVEHDGGYPYNQVDGPFCALFGYHIGDFQDIESGTGSSENKTPRGSGR